MAEKKIYPIKYMSFGSPLMDCISDVSKEFIRENNIELNTTIHRKLSEIKFLHEFLTQNKVTYIPGGCQFNAMRVFNWMLEKDETDVIGFLGSIGDQGTYGQIYKNLLKKENIIPVFETIKNETTGLCVVICCNRDRAHITDLGASTLISKDFVERNWYKFENVKLIYTELFIIKSQKDICYKLAELGLRDETIYGFNLPSEYFLRTYSKEISELCEYADIIFANEEEALIFCQILKIKIDNTLDKDQKIKNIASQLCKNINKKNKNKRRIVIVTCGPNPASCSQYDHQEEKEIFSGIFPVKDVPVENIVDTNGAGDAFAGGFLSQFVKGKNLDDCMKAGHWAASIIIQKRGCEIPINIKY